MFSICNFYQNSYDKKLLKFSQKTYLLCVKDNIQKDILCNKLLILAIIPKLLQISLITICIFFEEPL